MHMEDADSGSFMQTPLSVESNQPVDTVHLLRVPKARGKRHAWILLPVHDRHAGTANAKSISLDDTDVRVLKVGRFG